MWKRLITPSPPDVMLFTVSLQIYLGSKTVSVYSLTQVPGSLLHVKQPEYKVMWSVQSEFIHQNDAFCQVSFDPFYLFASDVG